MTEGEVQLEKGTSLWSDAWKRLFQNRAALIGAAVVLFMGLLAVFFEPLSSHFTRFTFASLYWDGFTRNVFTGENWSNQNTLAFQGAVRIQPIEDLTIDVFGSWSRNYARPRGAKCNVGRSPSRWKN